VSNRTDEKEYMNCEFCHQELEDNVLAYKWHREQECVAQPKFPKYWNKLNAQTSGWPDKREIKDL
jgi:hypothetical protein